MRRKNPKRKPLHIESKKRILKILGKKRITPTRSQRVSARKTFKAVFGYEKPRLSMAVGRRMADGTIKPGNASRYTVRKRLPIYEVQKERMPGERIARRDTWGRIETDPWGNTIYDYRPPREVVTSKKLIGEKLVVKRKGKKGGGKKGGSQRGQGPVRYGSAAAVRVTAKKAKSKRKKSRGGKPRKEKKKQKKR